MPNAGKMLLMTGRWSGRLTPVEVAQLLRSTVESIGMTVVSGPFHWWVPGRGPQAFVILAESHISFHGLKEKPAICAVDVFSCRWFSHLDCKRLLVRALNMYLIDTQVVYRPLPPNVNYRPPVAEGGVARVG